MIAFAILLVFAATVSDCSNEDGNLVAETHCSTEDGNLVAEIPLPKTTLPRHLTIPRIDPDANWKVVGGSDAGTGEFPFMVSVRGPVNNHFCGGSLLHSRAVLTAAHCLVGELPEYVFAVAGTNQLTSGGVSIGAQRLAIHTGFDFAFTFNDVGIVVLQWDFQYSNLISPISLNYVNTGAVSAILTGWGVLYWEGPTPNNLQRVYTQTITHSQCQQYWGSSVIETQICASTVGGVGACVGDSGGPLFQTSDWTQLGIVSFGVPCAIGNPDVYTRVSSFTDWIWSNAW